MKKVENGLNCFFEMVVSARVLLSERLSIIYTMDKKVQAYI
jgi:hypothetical protein